MKRYLLLMAVLLGPLVGMSQNTTTGEAGSSIPGIVNHSDSVIVKVADTLLNNSGVKKKIYA